MYTGLVNAVRDGAGSSTLGASTTLGAGVERSARRRHDPVPGVILVFAEQRPQHRVFRLDAGPVELGRTELGGATLDPLISRRHVRFSHSGAAFHIEDLGSRNGTFVSSKPLTAACSVVSGTLIRVGGALFLASSDVVPFEHYGLGIRDDVVGGPSLRMALEAVSLTRSVGMVGTLLVTGESGTGKEIAAQVFHATGARSGAAFSAVNCATIPKELAERLLFGSRRGAYSGATDAVGYVQAADGGTLFLDEVGELPAEVQSKLLRMLETREVLRLGATVPEAVEVRVCAATLRDLRAEVSAGRFREDLYFRIGQPEIRLPPLRERAEEVPWHIQQVLDACAREGGRDLRAGASFVEACMLRHWPGNVRELRSEVRRAAATVVAHGETQLNADDLSPTAGTPLGGSAAPSSAAPSPAAPSSAAPGAAASSATGPSALPEDEVALALAESGGNVASAARQLGVHRNKVRRWLDRHRVEARLFKSAKAPAARGSGRGGTDDR